jgi:hypothetical protein
MVFEWVNSFAWEVIPADNLDTIVPENSSVVHRTDHIPAYMLHEVDWSEPLRLVSCRERKPQAFGYSDKKYGYYPCVSF